MSSPGRPRLVDRRRPGATPYDEILDAAAELFTTRGFTATTTRAIAEAVGVRQASLYTHFASKTAMLVALLDTTVAPTLEYARRLEGNGEPADRPASDLLLDLATADVRGLLDPPWNVGALYLLPEIAHADFADFRRARSELRAAYRGLVERCDGGPAAGDPLADLPFRIVESVILHRQDAGGEYGTDHVEIDCGAWALAALRAIGITPSEADRGVVSYP